MPDDLNLALDREVILAAGGPSTGKSHAIVQLAIQGLEEGFNVTVIDRDRGVAKAIKEFIKEGIIDDVPDNMDYFIATSWEKVMGAVDHAFANLGTGDWLCYDMIGGLWDLAQDEFTRLVYEETGLSKMMALRQEAEALIRDTGIAKKDQSSERARAVGFEGLEGRYDWPLIKKMHNADMRDRCILNGDFNILATTAMTPLNDKSDKDKWPMFAGIARRPEGEKNNFHKHDTIVVLEKHDDEWSWRTDLGQGQGKDRGRELARGIEYTGRGFVDSYLEHHGLGVYA